MITNFVGTFPLSNIVKKVLKKLFIKLDTSFIDKSKGQQTAEAEQEGGETLVILKHLNLSFGILQKSNELFINTYIYN